MKQKGAMSSKAKWAIYGAIFGVTFPVVAMVIRTHQHGFSGSLSLFESDPLLWIIMTAPFFLGLFAFIAGNENDRLNHVYENLEVLVQLRTKELEDLQLTAVQASKMAALGEMAGGIAHEINNPLSIILFKASILEDQLSEVKIEPSELQKKIVDDIAKIKSTAIRISKIIKGLKIISRNSDDDPMEKIVISQIVEDSLELCRDKFLENGITYTIDLGDCGSTVIKGRPAQLSQVLINLFNNAIDAVLSLSEKWIELKVLSTERGIKISVTDSGAGISKQIVEKIMQPFFTTKGAGKGTGLGLSISKGIIEKHHGTLNYNPDSAHTQFVIELPR